MITRPSARASCCGRSLERKSTSNFFIVFGGNLINAVLLMRWANYRKAKAHCGFDINHGIPNKIFLTEEQIATVYKPRWTIDYFLNGGKNT